MVEVEKIVTLISRDKQRFPIPREAAILSGLVRDTLHVNEEDDDDEESDNTTTEQDSMEMEVLRVSGKCLQKVVEFLAHHVKEPLTKITQPLPGNSFDEIVQDQWYRDYMGDENMESRNMRFEILAAANYMEVKPLIDLVCLWTTFELAGKTSEEIRVILNQPEMSAEEEAKAREEHPWVFEQSG